MKKMKKTINTLIAAACLLPTLGLAATTVTLNPVADAYVQNGNKNAAVNYGSATELRAQTNNSASNNYDSYLRFDTSAIAEQVRNSSIVGGFGSAKLRVYAALSGSGSVSTSAYGVSDTSWSESAITWNTKPAFGSNLGSATVADTAYAWQEIDVSTYVQNEISAGRNVISLGLHNGATSSVYVNANSREAANPPQLVIAFNNPPTASITAPAEGSVYTAPASVTMSADAIDSDGSIAYVTFVVYESAGASFYNTVEAPPFTYTLNGLPAGSYSIYAKATDNDGGEAPPPTPVNFTVNPANVPPSVSLTSPAEGSSYTAPASITLTADATDSDGSIASVEFYDGANLIASLTAPPYSYTWNDVPAGSHSLTAKATDNQGTATTSTPATISVNAVQASGVYYIHADHLNTPRVITDANNRTVWRWDSDPFGAEKPNEDPDGDGAKFTYNLRFPGQYYDKETNLHYNYFRDYDPTTGRYVQSDPIGLEGGLNAYAYVGGNPFSFTDRLGLFADTLENGCAKNPYLCELSAGRAVRGASRIAKSTDQEESCGCKVQTARETAMHNAYFWAGIPIGGGRDYIPIPWSDIRSLDTKSAAWAEFIGNNTNNTYQGYWGGGGKASVKEHPFGHPNQVGGGHPDHHACPHFHAVNKNGVEVVFEYKSW